MSKRSRAKSPEPDHAFAGPHRWLFLQQRWPKAITVKKGATVRGQCFFPATINKVLVCHLSIRECGKTSLSSLRLTKRIPPKSRKVRAGNCKQGVARPPLQCSGIRPDEEFRDAPRFLQSHLCIVPGGIRVHTVAPFAYRSIMTLLVAGDCTLRNGYSRGPVHASGGPDLRIEARCPPNRLQPGHPST